MTDNDNSPGTPQAEGTESAAAAPSGGAEPRAPRVIGTPPSSRTLLSGDGDGNGDGDGDGQRLTPRELPSEPADLVHAKKAERVVVFLYALSMVAGIGFIAAYIGLPVHTLDRVARSNLALGLAMSVALLGIAAGATIWVRHLMPYVRLTEQRKPLASGTQERQAFAETFSEGAGASQFVKRPLLRRSLIAATLPLGLAPLVLLRDLGPLPGTSLRHTVWRQGMRLLVYGSNTPLTSLDFDSPGGMITVVPEGYQDDLDALAKAAVIIIKFRPEELQPPTVLNWTVDGIVAYSKICTHVGCPVALYEQTTHHILCPCHQSTFDARRGATVIFGPAARRLPQLPITTDAQGYLVAQSDFHEPVGPSFWERG